MNPANVRTHAAGMVIARHVWSITASPVLKQIAEKTGSRKIQNRLQAAVKPAVDKQP